jgi:hypothetical protein
MARIAALAAQYPPLDAVRSAVVCGCALALILAGPALPAI